MVKRKRMRALSGHRSWSLDPNLVYNKSVTSCHVMLYHFLSNVSTTNRKSGLWALIIWTVDAQLSEFVWVSTVTDANETEGDIDRDERRLFSWIR